MTGWGRGAWRGQGDDGCALGGEQEGNRLAEVVFGGDGEGDDPAAGWRMESSRVDMQATQGGGGEVQGPIQITAKAWTDTLRSKVHAAVGCRLFFPLC